MDGAYKATMIKQLKGGTRVTNVKLLEELIQRSGLKKGYLAKEIGVSRSTFHSLLNNKAEFKTSQVKTLCRLLNIKEDKTIKAIFFASRGA